MSKKEAISLTVLLFLLIMPAAAQEETIQDEPQLEAETISVYDDSQEDYNQTEIPEAVLKALNEYLKAKKAEKEIELKIEEEKRKRIEWWALILPPAVIIILFFLVLKKGKLLHKIKRKIRRQVLFNRIIKLTKKGLPEREIKKLLIIKGWHAKHVGDALHRYKKRHLKKEDKTPAIIIPPRESGFFHKIRRKFRRRLLFARIRKLKRKKLKNTEIKSILLKKGWKKKHVIDAIYRYDAEIKKQEEEIPALVLPLKKKHFRRIRRKFRRQLLFTRIRKLKRKKLENRKIKKLLIEKGWQERHVIDALHRYDKYLAEKDEKETEPSFFSSVMKKRSLLRIMSRKILLSKVRKLKRKGKTEKQIITILIKKGWEREQIKDSLYLYKMYNKLKR